MMLIGITGPTGSGKSAVSAIFRKKGFTVIDADTVARQVTAKNGSALPDLAKVFGPDILHADGTLRRRRLGDIAFANAETTKRLNATIFPHIIAAIDDEIEKYKTNNNDFLFLDAPTLFESGIAKKCQRIIAVLAEEPIRRQRIIAREPDLSEAQITARIGIQPSDYFYTEKADFIIYNNHSLEELAEQTSAVLNQLEGVQQE